MGGSASELLPAWPSYVAAGSCLLRTIHMPSGEQMLQGFTLQLNLTNQLHKYLSLDQPSVKHHPKRYSSKEGCTCWKGVAPLPSLVTRSGCRA